MSFQPRTGKRTRSNPAFRNNVFSTSVPLAPADRMTMAGTLNKTLLLVLVVVAAAIAEVILFTSNPGAGMTAAVIGSLAGFGVATLTIFVPNLAPTTSPIYAALEGLAIGGVSLLFEKQYPGIVVQATLGTLFTALVMMVAYRSQVIRVTPMFYRIVIFSTFAILLTYVAGFIMSFFGASLSFITSATPLGIAFSVFCVGIASLNLILDYDYIANASAQGAPKKMEWYGAFSLLITLVWLYLEMLRLISKLRAN